MSESIDQVVRHWVGVHGIELFIEEGDNPRQFFFISSPQGETFQFVIEAEAAGVIRIDAHLIEAIDDEEAHFIWEVAAARIEDGLALAVQNANQWFDRPAGP